MKEVYLYTLAAVLCGGLIDFVIGDFQGMWHPVISIGKLISFGEKILLGSKDKKSGIKKRISGLILWLVVVSISAMVPAVILYISYRISKGVFFCVNLIMAYQIMATGSLRKESMKVYYALAKSDLEEARNAVSMIVGRDTQSLDEIGVTKACVETVAENTCDGCIAPLLYMILGGPVAGFLYKAVNTMDSMLGYKNDKYMDFGFFAAKMDDLFNLLPARLGAVFMMLGGGICSILCPGIWGIAAGASIKGSVRIFFRDRYKSPSPNSAQTESVMAGVLGVSLLGPAYYFGKLHDKAKIGDELRAIEIQDIKRANILLYVTVLVAMLVLAGLAGIVVRVF